jgi:hypothetical protein
MIKIPLYVRAAILLFAGLSAAEAGPAVPSSDLAGRERFRFEPSPLDRFMQPTRPAEPLLRWECDDRNPQRSKQRARRNRDC